MMILLKVAQRVGNPILSKNWQAIFEQATQSVATPAAEERQQHQPQQPQPQGEAQRRQGWQGRTGMKLAKQQQDKDSADTNQPTHSSAKHKKRQFLSGDMGDLTEQKVEPHNFHSRNTCISCPAF